MSNKPAAVQEAEIEVMSGLITNIQQWLVILGFNAQLGHFNQEVLRVTLRTGEADSLFVVCRRWGNFIEPYMKQHQAKLGSMINVDALTQESAVVVQVVR